MSGKKECLASRQKIRKKASIKAVRKAIYLRSAFNASSTPHLAPFYEVVEVLKSYPDGEGGGYAIFISSLGRERDTIASKLDFRYRHSFALGTFLDENMVVIPEVPCSSEACHGVPAEVQEDDTHIDSKLSYRSD